MLRLAALRGRSRQEMWCLNLCDWQTKMLLLRRWRVRRETAKYREKNREIALQRTREWRRRAAAEGYYSRGGNGYRGTQPNTPERKAYLAKYYREVRLARQSPQP